MPSIISTFSRRVTYSPGAAAPDQRGEADYDPRVTSVPGHEPSPARIRILLLQLVLLAATVAAACGTPDRADKPAATARSSGVAVGSPSQSPKAAAEASGSYDLAADEHRGGHTLERHVGRTDAELAERLRRERQISAASTYPDAATASRVVGDALAANRSRVSAWAARSGSRPNLVLLYRDPARSPIGRSLSRGARTGRSCSSARVVLRWQERDNRWIVLTSYPETP